VLISEHGSVGGCGGGACLEHAHVSIVPISEQIEVELELRILRRASSFCEAVKEIAVPYILVGRDGDFVVHEATQAQSQLIRKQYCEQLNRDDWDWALFPAEHQVDPTILMWSEL